MEDASASVRVVVVVAWYVLPLRTRMESSGEAVYCAKPVTMTAGSTPPLCVAQYVYVRFREYFGILTYT